MEPSRFIPATELGGWVVAISNDGTYGYGHSYTGSTLNTGHLYTVDFATGTWTQKGAVPSTYTFDSAGGNWCFPLETDRHLYVVLNNGSDQYSLWRSTDDGDTFTKIIDLGDFTSLGAGAQTTAVSLLKCVAEYDGGVVVAEYNVTAASQAAPHYTCRLLGGSSTGSLSVLAYWGDAATDNTSGKIRHWHVVKTDPYTGKVWLSSGDNGQGGAALDGYQTHLIEWDPDVGTWANNTAGNELNALDGFTVYSAETYGISDDRFRAIEMIITEDYVYWACDTSTAGVGGIWRLTKATGKVSQVWKMPSWMTETNFEGWSGRKFADGTMMFSFSDRGSSESVRRGIQFVTSKDGHSWVLSGRGTSQVSQFARAQHIFETSADQALITYRRVAGRATIYHSYLYNLEGEFIEDEPDILCPVFWVGGDDASDSNAGYRPSDAWATLEYALESGVCYGCRIMVSGSITETDSNITPLGTNAIPVGPANSPIQITGGGKSSTTWTFPDTVSSANIIVFPSNANLINLVVEKLTMNVAKTDAIIFFGHSSLASKVHLRDAEVRDTNSGAPSAGIKYVFYLRNLTALLSRSYIEAAQAATNAYAPIIFIGSGATITADSSVIYGGFQNVRYDAEGASYFYHTIMDGGGTNGALWVRQTLSTVPQLDGCILLNDTVSINDDVGLTWTNAVRNCYLESASDPTTIKTSDAVDLISAAPELDSTYLATADEYAEQSPAMVKWDLLRQRFKNPGRAGAVEYQSGIRAASTRTSGG